MIRSAASLGVLQIVGYVVPFATLAVVGRLAPEPTISGFLFVLSLAALLSIIVEYGFHLSAVRMAGEAITVGTERKIYSTIHGSKALLFGVSLVVGVGVACFGTKIRMTPDMLLGGALAVFSYGFRPLWYYQVHENFRDVFKIEIVANVVAILAAALVALYIPRSGFLAIAWSAPRFIATTLLILKIHRIHGFEWIPIKHLVMTLRESFPLFLQKGSASAVHLGIPVILAYLVSQPDLLGFQRAERIFTATQSVLFVISQASYALIAKNIGEYDENYRIARQATFYQVGISFLAAIFVIIAAPWLVFLFWGVKNSDAIILLQLYAFGFPLLGINAAIGLNYLLPRKKDVVVVGAAIIGAAIAIALVNPFVYRWGTKGAILSVLFGEFCMLLLMSISFFSGRKSAN
jgi:polysaccharide transporter, PST family